MNLVTGGTGLLGSHLIYDLLIRREKVKALKRPTSDIGLVEKVFSYYTSKSQDLFKEIEWIEGDILDYYSIMHAMIGVDHVYHCAAIVSFEAKERQQVIHDNVLGTANIVNASLELQIKKYCHVSSIAALGKSESEVSINEESQWIGSKNKSAYSISKHLSEMEVWRGMAEGLNAVIVNPSIILGPGNWENGSSKIFSSIFKGLRFYTKGVIGYVDVRDVSRAMIQLIGSEISGERFILNAANHSYEYVFKNIASHFGMKKPDIYARKWMSEFAWRLQKLNQMMFGKPALITKETARTAYKINYYSSQKIISALDFIFIPIEKSIADVTKIFLHDLKLKD